MDKIPDTVRILLDHSQEYHDTIESFVNEYVYNLGTSAEVGARYIIDQVFGQVETRWKTRK